MKEYVHVPVYEIIEQAVKMQCDAADRAASGMVDVGAESSLRKERHICSFTDSVTDYSATL